MDRSRRHGALLDAELRSRGTISFRSSKQLQFSPSSSPPPAPSSASAADESAKKSSSSSLSTFPSSSSSSSSRSEEQGLQWPSLRPHQKAQEETLPESLKLLEEFYFAMETSIGLLNIRKATCSFSAIAKSVECSTQRRFLSSHLAQIKYIFPEALKLEEFTSWSSEMHCFRKDMRIKLLPVSSSRVEEESLESGTKSASNACEMVARRKELHKRLMEYARAHPEGVPEIPEADLLSKASCSPAEGNGGDNDDDDCSDIEIGEGEDEEAEAAIVSHTAFNPAQLKKFPRSPSKIAQARHILPKSALSHLPSTFKRHFSARIDGKEASASIRNLDNRQLNKNEDSRSGKITSEGAQKEEESCKEAEAHTDKLQSSALPHDTSIGVTMSVSDDVKAMEASSTPRKRSRPLLPSTPKKEAKMQSDEIFMSPPHRVFINASKCETPNLTPCSILGNPFASPNNCSTPSEDISTPSMPSYLSSPLPSCAMGASPYQNAQSAMKKTKQRQAVIKALRFGHTSKSSEIEEDKKSDESKDMAGPELSSPNSKRTILQTQPNHAASMAMRSRHRAIHRSLPFDSPKKKVPVAHTSIESPKKKNVAHVTFNSPKRARVSELRDEALTPSPKRRKMATIPDHVVCQQLEGGSSSLDTADYCLTPSDMDILQCLPKELLDNVQAKERKLMADIENGLEESTRRKQMIAGLPKLFNAVRLIFQSANRTVFTCKDLTRMVLSAHPDITDQGEIVEQLQLLVEFAPQWISARPSSTGEHIYRIDKRADMKHVSKILSQAK